MPRRRTFLRASLALGATTLAAGGFFAYRIRSAPHPHYTSLDEVRTWLAGVDPDTLRSEGVWTPAQILNHCAQSLEYSLSGFPEPKPKWFQATVGPAAFALFRAVGGMKHDRSEPVPGSVLSDLDSDVPTALARLETAMDAFEDPARGLEPHFAYGELDRPALSAAHAMHISEHITDLRLV